MSFLFILKPSFCEQIVTFYWFSDHSTYFAYNYISSTSIKYILLFVSSTIILDLTLISLTARVHFQAASENLEPVYNMSHNDCVYRKRVQKKCDFNDLAINKIGQQPRRKLKFQFSEGVEKYKNGHLWLNYSFDLDIESTFFTITTM